MSEVLTVMLLFYYDTDLPLLLLRPMVNNPTLGPVLCSQLPKSHKKLHDLLPAWVLLRCFANAFFI
jgi:hypothetical protein